jgi:hypothetical protein
MVNLNEDEKNEEIDALESKNDNLLERTLSSPRS